MWEVNWNYAYCSSFSINFRLAGIYQYSVLNQFEAADADLEEDYPEFTQVLSYYLIILLSCYPVIP